MTVALCNPDAYYPFRSLVQGPLRPADLGAIERFVRSVVLHDTTEIVIEPMSDPGEEVEWTPEEEAAGVRNVVVGFGPVIDDYEQIGLLESHPIAHLPADIQFTDEMLQLAVNSSGAKEGPYYRAHLEFIYAVLHNVQRGGSIVCNIWNPENLVATEEPLGHRLMELVTPMPANINLLFEHLDQQWADLLRSIDQGEIGLTVPPFLSIALHRAARRDAIPQILADMKQEFSRARELAWRLIGGMKTARTIAEAQEIRRQLEEAAELMNPARAWPSFSPVRMLWRVAVSAVAGAGAAQVLHAEPRVGAVVGAINQVGNIVGGGELNFQQLFRTGAFDLARRTNVTLRDLPRGAELLRPLLSDAERQAFGI